MAAIMSEFFDLGGTIIYSAAIYMVVGPPAAWMLWYRRIYNAAAKDRAITYMCFFLDYAVHVGFCGWAALGGLFVKMRPQRKNSVLANVSALINLSSAGCKPPPWIVRTTHISTIFVSLAELPRWTLCFPRIVL